MRRHHLRTHQHARHRDRISSLRPGDPRRTCGRMEKAPGFFRPCARFFTISSKYDRTGSGRQMKNKSARRIWQRAAFILCVCLFPVFNGHARLFEDLLIVGVGGKVARSRIFSAQRLDSVFELTELEVIDIVPFNI